MQEKLYLRMSANVTTSTLFVKYLQHSVMHCIACTVRACTSILFTELRTRSRTAFCLNFSFLLSFFFILLFLYFKGFSRLEIQLDM